MHAAARDEVASPGTGMSTGTGMGMGMGTRRLVANFNKRLQMINVNKAQTQPRQLATAARLSLETGIWVVNLRLLRKKELRTAADTRDTTATG